jgi:hypothetical protein
MRTNADITIELRTFIFGDFGVNIKAFCKIKGDVHKPTIARSITKCLSQMLNACGFSLLSHSITELKGSKYSIEVHLRNNKAEFKTPNFTEDAKNIIDRKIRIIVKSDQENMTGDIAYIIKERLANLSNTAE